MPDIDPVTLQPFQPGKDPWEDDQFAPLDLRTGPEHFATQLAEIANSDPVNFPSPEAEPVVPAPPPPAPAAPTYAAPDEISMEDGSTVTTWEDAEGWHASVDPKNGKTVQVFHGRTERELLKQLAIAQANATKKINQQEKQIKLVRKLDEPTPAASSGQVTADQMFEVNTIAKTDLVGAFNKLLQYTTGNPGITFQEFVNWMVSAQNHEKALKVGAEFRNRNPRYFVSQRNEDTMLDYLRTNKLDFTVKNLEQAFGDLSEAGLLDEAPKPQPVATVPPQPTPAPVSTVAPAPAAPVVPTVVPTPVNPRIERPAGRANATFGLRESETTTIRPPSTTANVPSAEEMENMTDAEIAQLFAGAVRAKAQQSARR